MLSSDKDPMGNAIADYYNGNKGTAITVNSSITENEEIPVEHLFRTKTQLPKIEKQGLKLCKGKVLDVGAGAGCHALILQQQGLDVQSIDISALAVDVMQKRGVKKALQIDFFDYKGETFDTILMLMNGLGIVRDLNGLTVFFEKAKTLLNKGGQIIVDSSDIVYMFMHDDGSMSVDLNADYYGELSYTMQYKDVIGAEFKWLYIDYETLQKQANTQGFNCRKILNGPHYDYLAVLTIAD
jgi:SAM-dependent methyltransferase